MLVFFTVGYFQGSCPQANALSQFALTCAIVDDHTFAIDSSQRDPLMRTVDRAVYNGHTYCDKSPVNAFLGVPVYAAYRGLTRALNAPFSFDTARYFTTWLTEGTAAAILAMLLAAALMRRGVAPLRAAPGAALWIAATPLLGYSVHFYNYAPACAFMLGGYLIADCGTRECGMRISTGRIFLGGLLMGLAAWTLNTCALAALTVTPIVIARGWASGDRLGARLRGVWRSLWPWALGGMIGVVGYFVYNRAVFGAAASPYAYEADPFFREQMSHGLMGATRPRLWVAWLLTGHKFQGLFLWFPLTALALGAALWCMVKRNRVAAEASRGPSFGERAENAAAVAVFIGLLTYTSAYYMWWGGYAYAPRHLIPALPLLGLALAPWLRGPRAWPARLLLTVGVVSAVCNAAAVMVDPQPFSGIDDKTLLHPELIKYWVSPYLDAQIKFWLAKVADNNWGSAVGLRGRNCILPLATAWLIAWRWLWLKLKSPHIS